MKVRAKMTCVSIEDSIVKFECKDDSNNSKEDNSFSEATPYGNAMFSITNKEALALYTVGETYYFESFPTKAEQLDK